MPPITVDTHHHFWNLGEAEYAWMRPDDPIIYQNYAPDGLEPLLRAHGIDKTVIVQSANTYEDTASMLVHSDYHDWVGAVTGWADLTNPAETERRMAIYTRHPKFRSVRHLLQLEADPDWVVRDDVIESLKIMAQHEISFEVSAFFPLHLKHVPTLANRVPNLKLVISHMAKPHIREKVMGLWADEFRAAAEAPNVYAKVSGLNTAADRDTWTADDIKPYIDFAIECFTPERLMFGSDWPVCLLAGDYHKVYAETRRALSGYPQAAIDSIFGSTAVQFYRLTL